mgnify:CR=1 FL=1
MCIRDRFRDEGFECFPGDVLRHSVGRGAVKEGLAGTVDRSTQEFDAGQVGLAETAACNEDSEAVGAVEDLALRVAKR